MAQGAEGTAEDIVEVIAARGERVHGGEPQQLAGSWVEAGFEDAAEIGAWIDAGFVQPDEARQAIQRGLRPEDVMEHGRDAVLGTTDSRAGLDQAEG